MINYNSVFFCLFLFIFELSFVHCQICELSQLPPQPASFNFKFCRQYEENSCCLVGHDSDIMDSFTNLVDVGDNCNYRKRNKAVALHQWYCLGCHPDQPSFIRGNNTVLICEEYADNLWQNGTAYDACGLRVTNIHCGAGFTECGDSIVVPSSAYGNVQTFMNSVAAYGFNPDSGNSVYNFIVVTPEELRAGEQCFNAGFVHGVYLYGIFVLLYFIIGL